MMVYQVNTRLYADEITDRWGDGESLSFMVWKFPNVEVGDRFTIISKDGCVFVGEVFDVEFDDPQGKFYVEGR